MAGESGQEFEIVPSHVATCNELTRLVAVLQEEFVVKHDGITIAFTGQFNPELDEDASGVSPAKRFARSLLSDVAEIPGNLFRRRKDGAREQPAGQLTIAADFAAPAFVFTLLIFRAYIYKEMQSPKESWWQGGV